MHLNVRYRFKRVKNSPHLSMDLQGCGWYSRLWVGWIVWIGWAWWDSLSPNREISEMIENMHSSMGALFIDSNLGVERRTNQGGLGRKSPVAFVCSFTIRIRAPHRRGISEKSYTGLKAKSKLLSVCHFYWNELTFCYIEVSFYYIETMLLLYWNYTFIRFRFGFIETVFILFWWQ